MPRHASATWSGDLASGSGTASTESGALQDAKVTFASRFENSGGSNPEELLAAAHASCFSMALANNLSKDGHVPQEIRTRATLTLNKGPNGFKITKIHLDTEGSVPGIDQAAFAEAAEQTKKTCPVSVLLLPGLEEATVSAKLR
ncbi:MAG: OsmC family peroxiredoxin [Kouleothrix sp.]|nr:OsmC family peroxiredoxin [Kouleothrix sp.]